MSGIPEIARRYIDGSWVTGVAEDGGGGSQPVAALLAVETPLDIHDAGAHPLLWDALYDNPIDLNSLADLPDGLGLAVAFDGTDATITTTDAGTWAFTLGVEGSSDPDYIGSLQPDLGFVSLGRMQLPGNSGQLDTTSTVVVALPTGATLAPNVFTNGEPTADPLNVPSLLVCVRVA